MKPTTSLALLASFMSYAASAEAANYSAVRDQADGIEVVRLYDEFHKTQVSIAPSLGNNAYEMKVNGTNVFWFPFASLAEFKAKPSMAGNPILAPWANRLDHDGFFANGKEYKLNPGLNNIRYDPNKQPIHGLITFTGDWQIVKLEADEKRAIVTSRLEFWRHPDWMAQFPFAHNIDMTYRLQDGILEVETTVENLAVETMPLSLGYHPYFQITDAPRDRWKVTMPAKKQVLLSKTLVPTGETKPMTYATPQSLDGVQLDDVFTGLVPGESGQADFSVEGAKQKISVLYGDKYPVAVVYAPSGRPFICFEPMTGPTNAFNLQHEGKYPELQTIAPGQKWTGIFRIQPSGF